MRNREESHPAMVNLEQRVMRENCSRGGLEDLTWPPELLHKPQTRRPKRSRPSTNSRGGDPQGGGSNVDGQEVGAFALALHAVPLGEEGGETLVEERAGQRLFT